MLGDPSGRANSGAHGGGLWVGEGFTYECCASRQRAINHPSQFRDCEIVTDTRTESRAIEWPIHSIG